MHIIIMIILAIFIGGSFLKFLTSLLSMLGGFLQAIIGLAIIFGLGMILLPLIPVILSFIVSFWPVILGILGVLLVIGLIGAAFSAIKDKWESYWLERRIKKRRRELLKK